jgi:hypothetical protein
MRVGIVGAIIAVLSIWLATSERADAGNRDHSPGRQGCAALVNLKHADLKGPARQAEIQKCHADADAYSKQAGF